MEATGEMRSILAKGQFKAGFNPLAVLDGVLDGNLYEAAVGGFQTSDTSAFAAAKQKLRTQTEVVDADCSFNEAVSHLREAAAGLGKNLIPLTQPPTDKPYVAYFHKGFIANPTIVVAEVEQCGSRARYVLTAFTAKVGLVQGHSCKSTLDVLEKRL